MIWHRVLGHQIRYGFIGWFPVRVCSCGKVWVG